MPPAIVLTGPTAAGKTAVALELGARFPVDLISMDSAQVYRGMDIGSAKPQPVVLERFPHALIDIREPEETYSAAEFAADAASLIEKSRQGGRIPLVVGGTLLYLNALRYGLDPLPAADPAVRARIEAEAAEAGWPALHRRLAGIDPEAARRTRPSDPKRIQRALEIHAATGLPPSRLLRGRGPDRMRGALFLVLAPSDRHVLHRRIDERASAMLAAGLEAEVRGLLERPGLSAEAPSLRAVGYRQVCQCLAGRFPRRELAERIGAATRQLAKRQITRLRQLAGALWYDPRAQATIDRVFKRVETFSRSWQSQY